MKAGRLELPATMPVADTAALFARHTVNLRHFARPVSGQYDKPAVHELVMAEVDDRRPADVRTGAGFRASTSYSNRLRFLA